MAYPAIKYNFGTATQRWYDEIKDYNFATGKAITPGKVVGHFTAQIWKNVKKVGYGFCTTTKSHVISPSRSLRLAVLYVVANYSPTPNVQGQYTVNVLRPI